MLATAALPAAAQPTGIKSVVMVHGAFVDGSGLPNVRFARRVQLIAATHSANFSAAAELIRNEPTHGLNNSGRSPRPPLCTDVLEAISAAPKNDEERHVPIATAGTVHIWPSVSSFDSESV
jgi:hypothetical protein